MVQVQADRVKAAVNKLKEESRIIQNRGGLTERQEEKVKEAIALLDRGEPQPQSNGIANQRKYLQVLRRVNEISGLAYVILCAAGLGKSAIAGLKDRVRVDLPIEIEKQKGDLAQPVLDKIASDHASKRKLPMLPLSNLTSMLIRRTT